MMHIKSISPTVFFRELRRELFQAVDVTVEGSDEPGGISLGYSLGPESGHMNLGKLEENDGSYRIFVPDLREPVEAEFSLIRNGAILDKRAMQWTPRKHWHVYFLPIAHHDYGYTSTIEEVLKSYRGFYEDILRYCDDTDCHPFEARFRYMVEQSWSVTDFVRNCSPALREDLVRRIKEGRIEIPALFGNEITNLCSNEELIRLLYPSFSLRRMYGIPISSAAITDIPGLSWGLPTVLGGAGVRYFFAGLPTYFEWDYTVHNFWDESVTMPRGKPDAFLWEGPDGSQLLVYYQGGYGVWTPLNYREVMEKLPGMLEKLEGDGYLFDAIRCAYRGGDNRRPDPCCSYIAREWNERWTYPKLIVGTNSMFFGHLDKGDIELPVLRGELPDTDYVVGATSSARETGINRITHDRLICAEKLSSMASFVGEEYPADRIREAWEDMLFYDEHTWGMAAPLGEVQNWDWNNKSRHAYRAASLTGSIIAGKSEKIASRVKLTDDGTHIVVFNPLSFERTDVVAVSRFWSEGPFDLIDAETGESIVHQTVKLDDPQSPTPYADYRYAMGHVKSSYFYELYFIADKIPSMGYRTYRVAPLESAPPQDSSIEFSDTTIENRFFRVTIDPDTGSVASIYDKDLAKELADVEAVHGINQPVIRSLKTGETWSIEDVSIHRGESGPIYGSMVIKGGCNGCPQVTQEVILYEDVKRIDFANRVLKDSTPFLELFFAFPFGIKDPRFRFEGTNSLIEPLKDQLPGSNTDYYAAQHWVDVSGSEFGVTFSGMESHLVELGGLYPGYVSQAHHGVAPPDFGHEFLRESSRKAHIYSYALVSNFRTNFQPSQHGNMLFRYSVTSHTGDHPVGNARDFGWRVHNPMIPAIVRDKGIMSNYISDADIFLIPRIARGEMEWMLPMSGSFCGVEPRNVLLSTLKQAEDGKGFIVRLIETEGRESVATITLPSLKIEQVLRTNIVEEDEEPLPTGGHTVTVAIKPFEIATVRILSI